MRLPPILVISANRQQPSELTLSTSSAMTRAGPPRRINSAWLTLTGDASACSLSCRILVLGLRGRPVCRALVNDLPVMQDDQSRGETQSFLDVVGDQHDGGRLGAHECQETVVNVVPRQWIHA